MRLSRIALLLVVGLVPSLGWAATTPTASSRQRPGALKKEITRMITVDYLLFLPAGYEEQKEKRWPLILFLHGAGERGDDLEKVKKHGPPKLVEQKPDFPFIVVSPQCPESQYWIPDVLIALLDEIQKEYRVDPRRVYLTGLSMGGYGAWQMAAEHPGRFAAIAPICGGGRRIMALPLRNMPVWAFHGAKDPVVPPAESEEMIDALKRSGNRDVKLTVYPEAGHDCWTETYRNPELYEWFLAHERPNPAKPAE